MNIHKCLQNLEYDLGNGGVTEDSFASVCYITMAKIAKSMIKMDGSQEDISSARNYISLCKRSGIDSLMFIAGS